MKDTTRVLASRIACIVEGHTAEEIVEAIDILKERDTSPELLTYLGSAAKEKSARPAGQSSPRRAKVKPIDQVTSKAVLNLEKTDPEKHRVLREFDQMLRQGKVLATNRAIRRFGEKISKDFRPKTSRKDNISALMSLLASLPQAAVERIVRLAIDNTRIEEADGYQNLANFLIGGNRSAGSA